MLKHYFLSSFRNLKRNKLYALINTFGLALGLSISFVIFSWVNFELNYDKFHQGTEQIYRLILVDEEGGTATLPPAAKTDVLDNIPEVEFSTRMFKTGQLGGKSKIAVGDQVFTNEEVVYADSAFFEVFTFPLIEGNPNTLFQKPNSVILTQTTAHKFFGQGEALGNILTISGNRQFEVVGIMEDIPAQSHFHFDVLLPMAMHPWGSIDDCGLGSCWMFHTYLKLNPNSVPQEALGKINELTAKLVAQEYDDYEIDFSLQSLADIHLQSTLEGEFEANNDIRYIYLFGTIAFLVIIIACINYINLATAYSLSRIKEVGIKKTLGAHKRQLFLQYLTESVVVALIAWAIAVFMIELARPFITSVTGYEIGKIHFNGKLLLLLAMLAVATGLLSGLVPSSFMATFQPINALKSKGGSADQKGRLRKGLVIFQFCISQVLLISTAVIYQQLQFLQETKLGYDKEHVLVLYTGYPEFKFNSLKESLLSNPEITSATGVSQLPTNIETSEGIDIPNGKEYFVTYIGVDKNFFQTMGIELVEGKDLVENLAPSNYGNKYVLNQAALKEIGWTQENALSQNLIIRHGNMEPGPVIGVIEDFHFQSLHFPISPLVLEFEADRHEYMLLKIKGSQIQETVAHIQEQWSNVIGNTPFDYQFLDEEYNKLYQAENQTGKLFIVFAILSTLIAMLGLFGLASYASFKRTKEIGIRKVFGASISNIVVMLSSGFTKLVVISFVIAAPFTYFIMQVWLQEFAYKTTVHPLIPIGAGLVVCLLALISVGYHAIKASITNPVDTLKNE